jgi:drug/metabolite transporter (DMT)-like permease
VGDAVLSVFMPGLGQLMQRRPVAGWLFVAGAIALIGVMILSGIGRIPRGGIAGAAMGLLALIVWAAVDAFKFALGAHDK